MQLATAQARLDELERRAAKSAAQKEKKKERRAAQKAKKAAAAHDKVVGKAETRRADLESVMREAMKPRARLLHTMGSDETAAALVGMLHTIMLLLARLVESSNPPTQTNTVSTRH